MSAPQPTQPEPPRRFVILPFIGAAILAAGVVFGVSELTKELGYGSDVHVPRVIALAVLVFVGLLVAFWPRVRPVTRGIALVLGLAAGVAAWVFLPCRLDGLSLYAAATQRESFKHQLDQLPRDQFDEARHLKSDMESLKQDYPSLAIGLDAALRRWAHAARKATLEQLESTSPDDIPKARLVQARSVALASVLPDVTVNTDMIIFLNRALDARVAELQAVTATDMANFDRTAPRRRELVDAFPETRIQLLAAEDGWATKMAKSAAVAYTEAKMSPREIRTRCNNTKLELLALRALDDSPDRFLAARRTLFEAAQEAARADVNRHIRDGRPDIAYTVATTHSNEWFGTAKLLGEDELNNLMELLESCRGLAKLAAAAGDLPEAAPAPRTRDTAPEPRPK
jgi:hypothetical protein